MEERLKDAERIVKQMEKEIGLAKIEELIKDNKIVFEYQAKKYRVRLLNLPEKEELDMLRRKKFGQLIKDRDILLEKNLIIQYKERGINIDEIDEKMKKLESEETNIRLKLGEAISKKQSETILKGYEEQIVNIILKKNVLKTQKNLLLEFSLENQLLDYVAKVITYLSLDELEDKTWKRKFNTLEEFNNYPDEKLINTAGTYSMYLQYI